MMLIVSFVAFAVTWCLTLDWGALNEFLILFAVGWGIIQLVCKKDNRLDAQKIYTILMLCYGSYAFLCHAYRLANDFNAIGSMDGPGYYLPCTMELFDSRSLSELIARIDSRTRYDSGGSIFVYFVIIAKLALNYLHMDLHHDFSPQLMRNGY